jgi:hypothetical protein
VITPRPMMINGHIADRAEWYRETFKIIALTETPSGDKGRPKFVVEVGPDTLPTIGYGYATATKTEIVVAGIEQLAIPKFVKVEFSEVFGSTIQTAYSEALAKYVIAFNKSVSASYSSEEKNEAIREAIGSLKVALGTITMDQASRLYDFSYNRAIDGDDGEEGIGLVGSLNHFFNELKIKTITGEQIVTSLANSNELTALVSLQYNGGTRNF